MVVDFQNKVRGQLQEDALLRTDYLTHLEEINEYVMFQLHQEFFKCRTFSVDDYNLGQKIEQMYDLPPEAYGLELADDNHEMRNCLKCAIKELA